MPVTWYLARIKAKDCDMPMADTASLSGATQQRRTRNFGGREATGPPMLANSRCAHSLTAYGDHETAEGSDQEADAVEGHRRL